MSWADISMTPASTSLFGHDPRTMEQVDCVRPIGAVESAMADVGAYIVPAGSHVDPNSLRPQWPSKDPLGADATEALQAAIPRQGSYFARAATLRASERRHELEIVEQEQAAWHENARLLEAECAELDAEMHGTVVTASVDEAVLGDISIARDVLRPSSADFADTESVAIVTKARAEASNARLEARSLEREEELIEAIIQERIQSSKQHGNVAQALQERVDSLENVARQEAGMAEILVGELRALESHALIEERRSLHEQRVCELQLQVAEATTRDAEAVAEDFKVTATEEEREDAKRFSEAVASLRASNAKRLAACEEKDPAAAAAAIVGASARGATPAAVPRCARSDVNGGNRGRLSSLSDRDQRSPATPRSGRVDIVERAASLLAELRERRASDGQRIDAARENAAENIRALRSELEQRSAEQIVEEMETVRLQSELRSVTDHAIASNAEATSAVCCAARLEQRVKRIVAEDSAVLVTAETRAAQELQMHDHFRSHCGALEMCAEELEKGIVRAKVSAEALLAPLRAELGDATLASEEAGHAAGVGGGDKAAAELADLAEARRVYTEAGALEIQAVEEACELAAAASIPEHLEELQEERRRRDRASVALAELRGALRQQHAAAEAAAAAAMVEEQKAESAMMVQLRLGSAKANIY